MGGCGRRLHDDGRPFVAQPLHRAGARTLRDRSGPAHRTPARNGAAHHGHHARVAALRARRHLGPHFGWRGLHRRGRGLPGLRAFGLGLHQVGRAALASTSRATSTPIRTPPSAKRSQGRATPGWRCGRAAGGRTTRRTPARWASATWPSVADGTTATCHRSKAFTPATPRTPCGWRSAWPGSTERGESGLTRKRGE